MATANEGPKILTFSEVLKLSPEESIKYHREHEAWAHTQQTEIAPGYSEKTHDEKVKSWSGAMNQQMRWQAESGLDPYAGYSPEWRENLLRFEPNFDALIQEAFKCYLRWEWSYEEYQSRVSR